MGHEFGDHECCGGSAQGLLLALRSFKVSEREQIKCAPECWNHAFCLFHLLPANVDGSLFYICSHVTHVYYAR